MKLKESFIPCKALKYSCTFNNVTSRILVVLHCIVEERRLIFIRMMLAEQEMLVRDHSDHNSQWSSQHLDWEHKCYRPGHRWAPQLRGSAAPCPAGSCSCAVTARALHPATLHFLSCSANYHHPHPRYINPGSLSWRRQRGCRGGGVNKYCLLTISQHIVNISHSCHHHPSHPPQCDGAVCDRQLNVNNRYCLLTRARGRGWWGYTGHVSSC